MIVVEAPGFGDDIQAIKAGILEIADILVINKADLPGVDITERALRSNLDHFGSQNVLTEQKDLFIHLPARKVNSEVEVWIPPLLRTIATSDTGIMEVIRMVNDHKEFLLRYGLWREKETGRLLLDMKNILKDKLYIQWKGRVSEDELHTIVDQVLAGLKSPEMAIEELIKKAK